MRDRLRHVGLVAAREFTERGRSRAFLVSNAFILVVIVAAVLVPVLIGGGDDGPYRLGVVGADAADTAALATGDDPERDLAVVAVTDRVAGEAALTDGTLDAVLLGTDVLLVADAAPADVRAALTRAAGATALRGILAAAGVDPADAAGALAPLRVEVVGSVDAGGPDLATPTFVLAFVAAFLLYGLLALLGQWVAQGIVEEKQSRIVEVLLSALRPGELLVGKVLGLGALGLLQLSLIAGAGLGASGSLSGVSLPPGGGRIIAVVLAWFLPGYLLYAMLFALTAATVSRVEDLSSASLLPIAVLVGSLLLAQTTLSDPTSTLASVVAFVPFVAPIVQPGLVAAGVVGWSETLLSLAVALATLALLVPLTARVYRGGVLRTARVSVREALRSGRAAH